jgi:hypothetical protein
LKRKTALSVVQKSFEKISLIGVDKLKTIEKKQQQTRVVDFKCHFYFNEKNYFIS